MLQRGAFDSFMTAGTYRWTERGHMHLSVQVWVAVVTEGRRGDVFNGGDPYTVREKC